MTHGSGRAHPEPATRAAVGGSSHSGRFFSALPVNEVKIDKSFVMEMTSDRYDLAIVRSVIDLASHLGLTVTAEGVEDREPWDALRNMGCTLVQGYYLSRLLPALGLEEWLQDRVAPLQEVTPLVKAAG